MAAAQLETDAVVLLTLDGVRWQEIFDGVDPGLASGVKLPSGSGPSARGLLPNIYRLFFDEGVAIGDPRLGGGIEASAGRHYSMPGYVEIATGAGTDCVDNACQPALGETIADAVAARGDSAAVIGSWSEIARASAAHPSRITIQTGVGEGAYALPDQGSYAPDRGTMPRALAFLREHRPRFLWVSLGDTDEWAHSGSYGGYLQALKDADDFVGALASELERMGARGARTAVFVTADHGRDPGFRDHGGPASGQVWLLARGPSIHKRGAISTSRRRQLRDLAPTLRAILGLPQRSCATCGEPIAEILPSAS